MKKLSLLCLAFILFSSVSFAQRGMNGITIRADLGMPVGDWQDFYKLGFGGSVMGKFGLADHSAITLRSGYMRFGQKDLPDDYEASLNIIPIFAGYRHGFSGFYAQGEAGIVMVGSKFKIGDMDAESEHNSRFGWAVGFGFARNGFDAGLRYESFSPADEHTYGFIGLHLGYTFMLGGGGTMSK